MAELDDTYRNRHITNQRVYDNRVKRLFGKVARDISNLSKDPTSKQVLKYGFAKDYRITEKIGEIMTQFESDLKDIIENASEESWGVSNTKNDEIVNQYVKSLNYALKTDQYFNHNADALKAFIGRERNTFTLSDRIFKIAENYRKELEINLGYGILNGDSADTINRRIRKYMTNPDKLFRRVRNESGNLVLSKAAKEYHPGRGIYRSSYKNAVRLTRTTTNQAYLEADHFRWNQIDFVLGVKISISESHFARMPEGDICDQVQGIYPKTFKWVGWHTQCFCKATPVLATKENFKKMLAGERIDMEPVTEYPTKFNSYLMLNSKKISGWKALPFYIQDNKTVKKIFRAASR